MPALLRAPSDDLALALVAWPATPATTSGADASMPRDSPAACGAGVEVGGAASLAAALEGNDVVSGTGAGAGRLPTEEDDALRFIAAELLGSVAALLSAKRVCRLAVAKLPAFPSAFGVCCGGGFCGRALEAGLSASSRSIMSTEAAGLVCFIVLFSSLSLSSLDFSSKALGAGGGLESAAGSCSGRQVRLAAFPASLPLPFEPPSFPPLFLQRGTSFC